MSTAVVVGHDRREVNPTDEASVMNGVIQQAVGLLKGFTEKEMAFALGVLRQIPERRIDDNSYVCEYGYIHGQYNEETVAAIEETEEILQQIKAGTRQPMTLEEFFVEKQLWLEEDDERETV